MLRLSFIVPCYNSERTIARCLESILSQTLSSGTYEVIVVDNGSTDGTSRIAREFSVRLITEERRGAAAARNAGASAAQGEYLAFVDSDVRLEKNWAETLLEEMGGFFDGAQGQVIPEALEGSGRWLDRYRYQAVSATTGGTFLNLKWFDLVIPLLNTAACIYRASVVRKVGGFNAGLRRCEDNDLTEKVLACGGAILGSEKTQAHVVYDRGLVSYLKRSFWIGFWRRRLDQAWQRNAVSARISFGKPFSGELSFRIFWRLNGWMRRIGILCSACFLAKEPPLSRLAVALALNGRRENAGAMTLFESFALRNSLSAISYSNKIFLRNSAPGAQSLLFQGEYKEAFLSLFMSKQDAQASDAREAEVLEILKSAGISLPAES